MKKKFLIAAVIGCASLTSHATPPGTELTACAFSDLSGVTVTKCAGFYDGNLINDSKTDIAAVKAILSTKFGVVDPSGKWIEKLSNLDGTKTIDFKTLMSGTTIVALHFGNGFGSGGPGNATAFYEFDAGSGLDKFTTNYNASSDAAIYLTTAVPEPETYAMLLAGLGLVGAIARRRRNKQA